MRGDGYVRDPGFLEQLGLKESAASRKNRFRRNDNLGRIEDEGVTIGICRFHTDYFLPFEQDSLDHSVCLDDRIGT